MDPKEYIESGKLESYALGNCTPEEMQEAECMMRIFPEVKREMESIRTSFEKYLLANKVEPPASLKSKIFEAIEEEEKKTVETKVINLQTTSKSQVPVLKYLIAASIALLVVSAYFSFSLFEKNKNLSSRLDELTVEQKAMQSHYSDMQNKLENTQKHLAIMSDPNAVPVAMKGLQISPQSLAMIYWNKESKEVYLSVNSLPQPPSGKQYQLWAIVNKAPVDLGVFDMAVTGDSLLHKMKAVDGASAFAITLENAGGSVSPTLDQMYVIGNI
ncbi:MAG TPA: anti-sigma factor [Bacteroidia bacterium]|nr:anti-sigma factor [Bacteroidia bacterium]